MFCLQFAVDPFVGAQCFDGAGAVATFFAAAAAAVVVFGGEGSDQSHQTLEVQPSLVTVLLIYPAYPIF